MVRRERVKQPKRGELYLARFDPTVGAEIKKTRPALILQADLLNRYSPITLAAPLTSQIKGVTHVAKILVKAGEGGLTIDSVILLNQIRSMDKARLIKRLGKLSRMTMDKVDLGLRVVLGLIES